MMRLSVIIPAYNEEKYLPRTMEAVKTALASFPDVEIIVVDNESTDGTREIAAGFGATIVDERVRNIAAVRNTGGQASSGEVLVFLDADTLADPAHFQQIFDAMRDPRCIGGAVSVAYETEFRRMLVRWFMWLWTFLARFSKMRQGALQFCRREVFAELGGYDTTIYVGEDVEFHWRLDKLAKQRGGSTAFIEQPKVLTSSRRWDKMGLVRMLFYTHPITLFLGWRVRSLWKYWYEKAIR